MPSFDFVDGYEPPCFIVFKRYGTYVVLVYLKLTCTIIVRRHVKPVVGRKINWMKAGITECDVVLTVSPHYVKELTSGPEKGVELDGVLRAKPLETGIVNGMDVVDWNPATDKYISVKYNATTVRLQWEVSPLLPVITTYG